jgi:DNA repair protein RecN (Recombination protein N)
MIERFYLKNYLSFQECELDLKCGLIVFSGASGSGKSILMNSILSSLGGASCEASLCESSVTWDIDEDETGIQNDDINVFKHLKKEKSRYFINNQSVSKKTISKLSSKYLKHLSLKDFSDFKNENLLLILDSMIDAKGVDIFNLFKKYKEVFSEYKEAKKELQKIEDEEKRIVELKEFASFEIEKIQNIDPKEDEDAELLEIKKELSKKEKVLEKISLANKIFEYEYLVSDALDELDAQSGFFDDAMNELRAVFDNAQTKFNALDDVDIEEVLNRIEELSNLKRRYGSIPDALKYKEQKIKELKEYENIEITKDNLVKRVTLLDAQVKELADRLTKLRVDALDYFTNSLNSYLKELYLRDAQVSMKKVELGINSQDELHIQLNGVELSKVSTGEFNRLRLGILALKSKFMKSSGVLMLDEIDANLSGEESMSVAKVLRELSKSFQIFVISHQPQLTSMGEQHFLVYKDTDKSMVKELNFDERVDEIARIISGESISDEAKRFAKELLEVNI